MRGNVHCEEVAKINKAATFLLQVKGERQLGTGRELRRKWWRRKGEKKWIQLQCLPLCFSLCLCFCLSVLVLVLLLLFVLLPVLVPELVLVLFRISQEATNSKCKVGEVDLGFSLSSS